MVYSAIKKVIIFDTTTSDYLEIEQVSQVIINENYNSYKDIELNYINTNSSLVLTVITLDTSLELINKLKGCNGQLKDFLIIGIDNKNILIKDVLFIFDIERKYPNVHKLLIKVAKDNDSLISVPDEDLLRGIGNFEKNDGQIGEGWEIYGTVTPSIIDSSGNAIQQLDFYRARAPRGELKTSIRGFLEMGESYNINGNVQNISGENNDLLINLILFDKDGNTQELNYAFPLPDNNSYLFSFSFIPISITGKIDINFTLPVDYTNQVIQLDNIQLIKE